MRKTCFLLALCAALFSAHAADVPLFEDRVVARGEGVKVTRSQLEEAFLAFKASAVATQRGIPESQRARVESDLLDRLIVSQLLIKRATDEDKNKGKEKSADFLKELKSRIASEELFRAQLKAMGITPDKFESRALEDAICEQVLEREVKTSVKVNDEQVKKYYEENAKLFLEPEMVKGWHILISLRDPRTGEDYSAQERKARREAIEKLRQRAKAGEDFTKLAKEFSEHPVAKENGGEFTIPRNSREPELESAAFSLEPNQVSDIITSPYGFHIIKLKEKIPAHKVELKEVQEKIREGLTLEEVRRRLPEYFEKLKKEAKVEVTL